MPSARKAGWFMGWTELVTVAVYLYGVHVGPVAFQWRLGNELQLTRCIRLLLYSLPGVL